MLILSLAYYDYYDPSAATKSGADQRQALIQS